MDTKQLREIVQRTLRESNNALVTTKAGTKAISYNNPTELSNLKSDSNVSSITTTNGQKLKEMSRTTIRYKLTDDYEDNIQNLPSSWLKSDKRMKWIKGAIEYIKDNGPDGFTEIAKNKFDTTQYRFADYGRAMVTAGILEPETAGTIPQFQRVKGSEADIEKQGDDELLKYFDKEPNKDGSEDFNDDEEPTLPYEPIETLPQASRKAADFIFDNDRLIEKIFNLFNTSKMKIKEAENDSGISSRDIRSADVKRKDDAISKIDELIVQLCNKIREEESDVQEAIVDILDRKLESIGATRLTKKIKIELGWLEDKSKKSTPEPKIVTPSEPKKTTPKTQQLEITDEGINTLRKLKADRTDNEHDLNSANISALIRIFKKEQSTDNESISKLLKHNLIKDVEQLDEYVKHKLQYYAGIRK
jgi:hypothetical protein